MDLGLWGLVIFVDGAARGNPGRGAWGMVFVDTSEGLVQEFGKFFAHTTNNEMELRAVVFALTFLMEKNIPHTSPIHIYTDSRYVYQGVQKWLSGWQRSGWLTRAKKPILHKELWQQCADMLEKIPPLQWHHIPGHSTIAGNERADHIASFLADGKDPKLFSGNWNEYSFQEVVQVPDEDELNRLRMLRKSRKNNAPALYYLSLVGAELRRHENWESCKARVHGTSSARYKKVTSLSEEKEILSNWGLV